jgi:hypothetical protein
MKEMVEFQVPTDSAPHAPGGDRGALSGQTHATSVDDARHVAAAENLRYQKEAAALGAKGTIPPLEVSGGANNDAAVPPKIDTTGPGWVKHSGPKPGDNYSVKITGNHEYQKVYADGTIEEVNREGDDGNAGQLDKTITYPSGNKRFTVMHVDAHEQWTEDPVGYMQDKHGNEHHWGPKPEDNYAVGYKDANHYAKVYADGSTEMHSTKLDPKTHEQTQLTVYTNQAGAVTKTDQRFPDGTEISTTPDRIVMIGRDWSGNTIQIVKAHNSKTEITLYRDGQKAEIGPDEIPQNLKARYKERVVPF